MGFAMCIIISLYLLMLQIYKYFLKDELKNSVFFKHLQRIPDREAAAGDSSVILLMRIVR